MLHPIAALAFRGIAEARRSPSTAAVPISNGDRAYGACRKKTSALPSLIRLRLFTSSVLSDGERSLRRTSPFVGEVTPFGVSDGAASPAAQLIHESKAGVLLSASSRLQGRRTAVPINKRPRPVRYAHILLVDNRARPRSPRASPVPSGPFHAGHVPDDRPQFSGLAICRNRYSRKCYRMK